MRKHYDNRHAGTVLDFLLNCLIKVLKKWQKKLDCLISEMLLIRQLRPCLNVQSDSILTKVFVSLMQINDSELLVTIEIAYLI